MMGIMWLVRWRRVNGLPAKMWCSTPREVGDKVTELLLMDKVRKVRVTVSTSREAERWWKR